MAFGSFGGDYSAGAPGAAFHQWDAVSKRRYLTSGGQRPSWDIPANPGPSGGLAPSTSASPSPTPTPAAPTDPAAPTASGSLDSASMINDWARNQANSDTGSQVTAAQHAAALQGGDPSLAAFGGMNALLAGHGAAVRNSNAAQLGWTQHLSDQANAQAMLRLQYQLAEEQQRKAQQGAWLGDLLQLGGTLGGAYLGRPAGAAPTPTPAGG